jgi:GNAT superfamily N-acetyltransferase
MKRQRTLITHRVYFGIEAQRLRDGSGRVMARVVGLAPERAHVSLTHLAQDFGLDTREGRPIVDELVAEGLLRQRAGRRDDFFPTERFAELAGARVVDPLARGRAKQLVQAAGELAAAFNAGSRANPLAIEAVAVFGQYMSLDDELGELELAIVVRPRERRRRFRWRRPASRTDGANEIRQAFRAISSFVQAHLVTDLASVPRPFAVVFQDL